jgi:hypothetical protein
MGEGAMCVCGDLAMSEGGDLSHEVTQNYTKYSAVLVKGCVGWRRVDKRGESGKMVYMGFDGVKGSVGKRAFLEDVMYEAMALDSNRVIIKSDNQKELSGIMAVISKKGETKTGKHF